ncbi:serine/threonine-protein kinase Nek4 [Takifugu rubripes]|uniref:Serine/threonine-protein kinase Nek4 n=1 Tax=Takifugu rubripes TaxID=31033 RepID=H2SHD7_TAKRU|nr:serine/threonine-protein kinase Nek4 [Takifugu rubripes]|eukprot:XP_011612536.1 PREDICTED: serine/threonine-protein kinase Nek4 [Takifugu rubripes]
MMNNYISIRVVGKGSYGEVNLVKHKTDRQQYVIKKLNLITSSKRERRAAEQEAQLLSQLRHPNIVTYRESWEGEDCQLYIVMGFCEGGDVYHRLKQQKGELLPERQVVEWFVQIAMALEYLHGRNILHRDLKTQNIFLTKLNIIKVGDLGIARVLENQNDMASTLIGTPYYMSPELFSNKPYNHKSDVWALGCCVYEMSTLKHAFNARDMNSLVYRIVQGKLPQMPSKYDPHLGELIKCMLCKRPEDRPDVKVILRQPYIKGQIALFLKATKEKTAKSKKKTVSSVDCNTNAAPSVTSPPKREKSARCESQAGVKQLRKEEKSHQRKAWNSVSDETPVQAASSPKPSSPDALKASSVSLATISNINIDMDEDLRNKELQGSQSGVSPSQALSHNKGRGKPDSSAPSVDPPLDLKSLSGDDIKEGEECVSKGLHIHQEKQTTNEDNTTDLLKDNNVKVSGLALKTCRTITNDTVTLLKGAPSHHPSEMHESLESTEKLLEPFPAVEESTSASETAAPQQHGGRGAGPAAENIEDKAPRALPPLPTVSVDLEGSGKSKRSPEGKNASAATISSPGSCNNVFLAPKLDRLTARERRRLKKSQEISTETGGGVKSSPDVITLKDEHLHHPVTRSVSDVPNIKDRPLTARERRRLRQSQESTSNTTGFVTRSHSDVIQDDHDYAPILRSFSDLTTSSKLSRLPKPRSGEDEGTSSTSSTEQSDVDYRERKAESCDMQDLVQMMTQTLRMDIEDSVNEADKGIFGLTALPEFKLNGKYRDTLALHGKSGEEAQGSTSGPAKIRRAIEHLRTDVVKGLGIKLLDNIMEIMEEEDDNKREQCLRHRMGDEKYQAYAVMVRQLKFLEDVAFKV